MASFDPCSRPHLVGQGFVVVVVQFLNKLQHLNLSCCYKLKETPDLSGAPNLKTLYLEDCDKLNYIHPSLAHHKSLVVLNLSRCSMLKTLGEKLEMSSLKKLDLQECTSLRRVPEFGECMKQLSILTIGKIGKSKLPKTFVNLVGLSELNFINCDVTGVCLSHGCFVGVKKLELIECSWHSRFLYCFHSLESLTVDGLPESESISTLMGSLSQLTSLTSLTLEGCFDKSVEQTPYYDVAHLALLTDLDLSSNYFSRLPIKLPSSLRELHAEEGCDSLDASNVNDVISKACCAFAESSTQDPEDILQMWINVKEIPAWFDHQEQYNGVSISFPHNCPSTETVALALCFQFEIGRTYYKDESTTVTCNAEDAIRHLASRKSSDPPQLSPQAISHNNILLTLWC
ncbi:hypothetical protein PIB30_094376 [Stylosanthes scabra]|uniref:C-JID domain-containing protein n=1 Tax=Stylosanthes scabra TaxID=79078 RepID=A0ABU6ZU43_9FABA|nr:hypothetical protein [Stylosanthes scabra]